MDPHDHDEVIAETNDGSIDVGLSPERRLDAIADVLSRGLARSSSRSTAGRAAMMLVLLK